LHLSLLLAGITPDFTSFRSTIFLGKIFYHKDLSKELEPFCKQISLCGVK